MSVVSAPPAARRAVALAANSLVVSTVMPATTAQVSASLTLTVVSAGSVGGVFPVALVHATLSSLRAANTAPAVTSVPIRRLPPLFLPIRSPPRRRHSRHHPTVSRLRWIAATTSSGRLLAISQYGAELNGSSTAM